MIGIAARLAERITFAVGADPVRLRWAIETARDAGRKAGLDPAGLSLGAWLNVVVHDDPEQARRLGEGGLALFARFSAMHGTPVGPASEADRALLRRVHDAYDMNRHARTGSPHAALLGGDFATRFAVYGPPAAVVARLSELRALGLERFMIVGASLGADRSEALACEARFVREVLPALHA